MSHIKIRGCNTNNLKNISVDIPLNKITCVTGPSGSGKSSLVFHTVANESKRRFLNSMPSSQNFFERVPQSADVELIEPVLPVWILPQNNPIVGSRLNLSDQFELTLDLARLYYRPVYEKCPVHGKKLSGGTEIFTRDVEGISSLDEDVIHFCVSKDVYEQNINGFPARSYSTEDSLMRPFDESDQYWELFRVKLSKISSLEKKLKEFPFLMRGETVFLCHYKDENLTEFINLKHKKICLECKEEGISFATTIDELIPFNGVGACVECKGYGSTLEYSEQRLVKYPSLSIGEGAISILNYSKFSVYESSFIKEIKKKKISLHKPYEEVREKVWPILWQGSGNFPGVEYLLGLLEEKRYKRSVRIFLRGVQVEKTCSSCDGTRVSEVASSHKSFIKGLPTYGELLRYSIVELENVLSSVEQVLEVKKIRAKLAIAIELGLERFQVTKKLKELETNEYQKSLLVRYLSYQGSGSLFVLDEPSLGLTEEEQKVLVKYLKNLSKVNTVLLVDHSKFVQKNSNEVIEVGPGAGHLGGEITYQGKFKSKKLKIEKFKPFKNKIKKLTFKDINYENYNVKKIQVNLGQVNIFKSNPQSFIKNVITKAIANELNIKLFNERVEYSSSYSVGDISGDFDFDNIIIYETSVDRASGRSTVGTMLGLTPHVRKYYSNLPVSKNLGLLPGHFSPNSDLGKCSVCEGKGVLEYDMQFLEDIKIKCNECDGKKLNKFYAGISDGNLTVHEAFNTPIISLFENIPTTPKLKRILEYLKLLKLDYLTLDRTLPSLSGGERLRVKLLKSLEKDLNNSLLIFNHVSYGLSEVELVNIRKLLDSLCGKGNTIFLIDNHEMFNDFNQLEVLYTRLKN